MLLVGKMVFVYAKTDEKGRLYFPKEIREEYGFDACPVKAEKKKGALVIHKHWHTDPVLELAKIGDKMRGTKGKTLEQLRKELDEYMAEQLSK